MHVHCAGVGCLPAVRGAEQQVGGAAAAQHPQPRRAGEGL
mgnify:CR=1 FL=1